MKTILRVVGTILVAAGLALCCVAIIKMPGAKGGGLSWRWQWRDKVITGAYKVYGLKDSPLAFWLAKSVFKNEGSGVIRNLKVRYKLGEYADWCSWQEYPELVPSQTVVDLYYPILSSKCAQLNSQTPAELQIEYEYVDSDGTTKQSQRSERLTMLGKHEFYFTDLKAGEQSGSFQDEDRYSPLLAAWVTSADMPVAGLASMANKRAGGVAASENVDQCIKAMRECYEIMRDIGITYQTPAERVGLDKSYDPFLVQSLQYPRDTIEKRSGTCIDLAILYAAMIDSIGVEPVLVSLDGHCFPMGEIKGQFIPVEATGVGGPNHNIGFDDANQAGMKKWQDLQKTGRYNLVRCRKCWAAGISPPELESLAADILERWGIRGLAQKGEQPAAKQVNITVNAPEAANPPATVPSPMASGQWTVIVSQPAGTSVQGSARVVVQGQQVQMNYTGQYQTRDLRGFVHQMREQNAFTGTITGQSLAAQCLQCVWAVDGRTIPPRGLPLVLNLTLSNNGRKAQGTVANALGQTSQVSMEAQ